MNKGFQPHPGNKALVDNSVFLLHANDNIVHRLLILINNDMKNVNKIVQDFFCVRENYF